MTAAEAARVILAGGLGQLGSTLPWAIGAAVLILTVAGAFWLLLFKGIARWRQVRGEDTDLPDLPRGGPELGDDVAEVIRGWAAEWDRQKGERR